MQENSSNDVSNKLLQLYRKEALQEFENHSLKDLEKSMARLHRRRGLWGWLSDKVGSFFNLVKIAAMSIFLGRRETSKRIDVGEKERQIEAQKSDAKKMIKIDVLNELIQGEKEKSNSEKEELEEKPEQSDSSSNELEEGLKEAFAEHEESEVSHASEGNALEQEEQGLSKSRNNTHTIFAQQTLKMTDKYQHGLKGFLAMQTGIDEKFIKIDSINRHIKVSFTCAPEQSQYAKGVTINEWGCCRENTEVARALNTLVLYYTAKEYKEGKNQTRYPGTIPSKQMIRGELGVFLDILKQNEAARYTADLFGHELTFSNNSGKIKYELDGNSIPVSQGQDPVGRIIKEFRQTILGENAIKNYCIPLENGIPLKFQENGNIKGDYSKISELSDRLHAITKEEIHENYYVKYSTADLQKYFDKSIKEFMTDNSGPTKGIEFHGHHIHLELNEEKEISGVALDRELIYGRIGHVSVKESVGFLSAEEISSLIALRLEPELYREKMLWNIEITRNDEPVVSELDHSGHLVTDEAAYVPYDYSERDYRDIALEEAELGELEDLGYDF